MQYDAGGNRQFGRIVNIIVKESQLYCTLAAIRLTGETATSPEICHGPNDEVLDHILAVCDYGKHFRVCQETEDYVCVKAEQIVGHCLLLPFAARNKTFISTMPLHFEHS